MILLGSFDKVRNNMQIKKKSENRIIDEKITLVDVLPILVLLIVIVVLILVNVYIENKMRVLELFFVLVIISVFYTAVNIIKYIIMEENYSNICHNELSSLIRKLLNMTTLDI
ncbi:hypothetical protein MKS88_003954 [Plasmodium brasilianum]|uniref:Uncharacterized protein n=1 Tax=Plasmodium brasilianum TaxID=5824 RepID=A0ACB9Y713_PLABR|nr:hypothetical protein MKS88_003954 [Plasmodium brasilianum]